MLMSCPVLSYPILSYPVLSCPILSYLVLSCPILSYTVLSTLCPVISCLILDNPVLSYLSLPSGSCSTPPVVADDSSSLSRCATLSRSSWITADSQNTIIIICIVSIYIQLPEQESYSIQILLDHCRLLEHNHHYRIYIYKFVISVRLFVYLYVRS